MTLESFIYVDDDIAGGLALWRPVTDQRRHPQVGIPFRLNKPGRWHSNQLKFLPLIARVPSGRPTDLQNLKKY